MAIVLYVDKEKIQALIDKQRTNLADVEYLDLEDVAKIVNNFENPTIEEEEFLEANDIRSFHGREANNIIGPIFNNKTFRWVDKKKGLAYLSSASQPVQQEIDMQTLKDAANIVKNFENPLEEEEFFRRRLIKQVRICKIFRNHLQNK